MVNMQKKTGKKTFVEETIKACNMCGKEEIPNQCCQRWAKVFFTVCSREQDDYEDWDICEKCFDDNIRPTLEAK
jgi:hypothetical protein